jgi:hypothetical protein
MTLPIMAARLDASTCSGRVRSLCQRRWAGDLWRMARDTGIPDSSLSDLVFRKRAVPDVVRRKLRRLPGAPAQGRRS